MVLNKIMDTLMNNGHGGKKFIGTVVLTKNNVIDHSALDRTVSHFSPKEVSLQLLSAVHADPAANGLKGKVGKEACLENEVTSSLPSLAPGDNAFNVTLDLDVSVGVPGALIVTNNHATEKFFLKTFTLKDVPDEGDIHFVCNSWIYPATKYDYDRVFFRNKSYLPSETPEPLRELREQELVNLRGNGKGERQEWDRVYDYAYYNDLGNPDKGQDYVRQILGGSSDFPYPRRGRTGRPPTETENKSGWRTDEEFGREMVAGVNPVVIRRLEEFPPKSTLDPKVYGDQTSKIIEDHIQSNLDGLGVFEALNNNKLFILDHHDSFMPYLRRINSTLTKTYASRTLLFLKDDGTLKPLAIELSLPHPNGDQYGAVSKVYTPSKEGVESAIWELAKAYVAVNDSGYHQLISHWLNTHAVIEPFVIATNRQLSALHPIHKLLQPHFRDTMNINALARQTLINAGGILEITVFPGKYAMEMSAVVYKNWIFPEQALPAELLKRGVAVEDPNSPHGLRLLIEDYPYAVDGLEIWSAIKSWVEEYCSYFYKTDDIVQKDCELQAWWKELREVGHGDKKDELWWNKMQTREELIDSCTIMIWIASALHAAVNFGQYPYAGFLPNRPTLSRRFMPEKGTPEYEELQSDPEKGFLKTITPLLQTLIGVSLIEVLSRHTSDEVYLGQRDTPEWTSEGHSLQAFERFGKKLIQIEDNIMRRNNDVNLKNRVGPIKFPYTLLHPTSEKGVTAMGIPNSVSI
ncbi:probable linoleate 9S-lipoxygenase 5 isoform X2 [Cannabis sativa]|uniref:probable linoleate 9S-lipoxygenase 5 isoform X2 n=1 Tax=Cannabis sativa TaxID=3483 RepID=UPI0029C9FE28|nr:probable linoleate 9S-lipoxygenase 5 isoform X2 [Cannabis sativa]